MGARRHYSTSTHTHPHGGITLRTFLHSLIQLSRCFFLISALGFCHFLILGPTAPPIFEFWARGLSPWAGQTSPVTTLEFKGRHCLRRYTDVICKPINPEKPTATITTALSANPTPTSTKAKAVWPLGNAAKTAADGRGCRRKSSP